MQQKVKKKTHWTETKAFFFLNCRNFSGKGHRSDGRPSFPSLSDSKWNHVYERRRGSFRCVPVIVSHMHAWIKFFFSQGNPQWLFSLQKGKLCYRSNAITPGCCCPSLCALGARNFWPQQTCILDTRKAASGQKKMIPHHLKQNLSFKALTLQTKSIL